jgi:glucose-6-phosphate-specific signal transduction histidine kinase
LDRFLRVMSRRAVTLLLLVVDFAALVVAHSLTELSAKATILLAVIVVVVSAAARNYRVQPIWRELAVLGFAALAAGGADTALKLQLGLPVHHGPMVTAAVFLVLAATGRAIVYASQTGRRAGNVARDLPG